MERVTTEKRRYVRYRTSDDVFAALGNKFSKVGRVQDISIGGLSFEYILEQWPSDDVSCIDIFVTSNNLHVSRIPCRLVYEIIVPPPRNIISLSPCLRPKRCGVEFVALTEEQIKKIHRLIDKFTIA